MSDDLVPVPEALADPRAAALALLDDREIHALTIFEGTTLAPIAEGTADRMFVLWLRGLSTDDIRRLNWGFTLGQIVHARVRYEWDRRLAEHDQQMAIDGAAAIRRSQMEAALLAADMISASAKLNRTRLHRYLQTGDEKDLGDLAIGSLRQLKESVEILLKATRQEGPPERRLDDPLPPRATVDAQVAGTGSLVELASARRAIRLAEMEAARRRRKRS